MSHFLELFGIKAHKDDQKTADRLDKLEETTQLHQDSHDAFEEHLGKLEERIQETRLAVAEGIERTDRAERRIKQVVTRAKKELRDRGFEDSALDAEAHELRLIDGEGGFESGLPTLPEEMADSSQGASSVPGVPLDTLRRARGF